MKNINGHESDKTYLSTIYEIRDEGVVMLLDDNNTLLKRLRKYISLEHREQDYKTKGFEDFDLKNF